MPVPLAELFISVSADVSSATASLNALNTQVKGTADAFTAARPAALALTGAATAIGAGFATSVKVAADFEEQMSAIKSVLTTSEVEQFGDALTALGLKLGRETVFSSREAASAIEELVKAGVPVQDVLNGAAAGALNLAAATGVSTTEAATIAAQAMNTFKLSGDQATAVVDKLAGVANTSASDISFLRFGMASAAGVAAGLGLSFNDTADALGIMSSRFATGSDAGTSFKTFLQNLQPSTKAQVNEFNRLGLTTNGLNNAFFDSKGHVKDLASISGTLRNALKGMTDQQRVASLELLFGTDAQRAALALYDAGAEGAREFAEASGEPGAAARAATTRLDNLNGVLKNLGGSFETLQIIVGDFFLPVLREVAERIKGPVDAFSTMSPAAQGAATALVGIAGAIAGALGGLVLLTPLVRLLTPSFAAFGRTLVTLLPFFRVAGLVAAILFTAWQTNLGGIRGIVQRAFDAVPGILEKISEAFGRAGVLWENTILPALQGIANEVERRLIPVFNAIITNPFFVNFGLIFQKALNGDVKGAVDTFQATVTAIAPGLGPVIQNVRTMMTGLITAIGPILANLGLVFQKLFAGDVSGALDTLQAILGAFAPEIARSLAPANSFAAGAGQKIGVAFSLLGSGIDAIVSGKGDLLATFFETTLPESLKTFQSKLGDLGPAFTQVTVFFGALGSVLDNLTAEKVAAASNAFGTELAGSLARFGTQLAPLVPVFQSIGGFLTALDNVITAVDTLNKRGQGVGDTGDATVGPLQSIVDFFNNNASTLTSIETLLGPIGPAFAAFRDNAAGISAFIDALAGALDHFGTAIRNLPELPGWLLAGIQGNPVAGVQQFAQQVAGGRQAQASQATFAGGPAAAGGGGGGFGGGAAGGGNVIFSGTVNINGGVELEEFANSVRDAVNNVEQPPSIEGTPALAGT